MPRHIRNIAIAVLLASLAIAAAINSYIHYQFQKNIDKTLSSIQPVVHVKYNELSTFPLSGEVKLDNIRLSSPLLPEEIILGDITLETPGFLYMLLGSNSINKGELPQHFGFSLNNFYFDLHSDTAALLDNIIQRVQPLYAREGEICGGKSIFNSKDYKEMGYSRLLTNMRVAYDFNKENKSLNINVSSNIKNMADVKANISIANVPAMSTLSLKQNSQITLSQLDIVYKDKTYTPRVIKYCSALSNVKKETYIDAEVSQSDDYFYKLLGFSPGKGLREAYKDFLSKPDVVTLSMTPSKNFNPKTISSLSNEELMKSLNVRLKINGLLVSDLSYTKAPVEFSKKFERQLAENLNIESLLRGEKPKAPEPITAPQVVEKNPPAYHIIDIADIEKHIDGFVQIITENDNERNGQLIRMDDFNLYVEKKVSGGRFTMTVPIKKIKTIKAFFTK